jgi:hypothetical protein
MDLVSIRAQSAGLHARIEGQRKGARRRSGREEEECGGGVWRREGGGVDVLKRVSVKFYMR